MAERSQRLAIIVTAQDLASGKLSKVKRELAGMGTGGKLASVGLGGAMLAVNKGGQALNTFKSRLTSLAAPLAMIGLTGGLFSIAGALEKGVSKAADFGESVDKAMAITGLGVEKASALSSALAYVGIDADATVKMLGMAEKNLGNLTLTTKKATDFQKAYGLSLVDSNGKAVDANELLLRSADYFNNKSIPASQKAAAMSKVYGKSWQSLVEVLELGRKKLADAEQTAADLGLTMTKDNVGSFEKFRDASREAGTAVGGLELQLGLLVMPDIASGLKTFAEYARTHQGDIKRMFADGLHTAEAFGGFITGTVVPAIQSISGAASGIWNSIPGPMQDLLVKGFVADRTMKFFFGMSPIHAVVSLAEGAVAKGLGGLVGTLFQRGSSPVNPMYVSDMSLGAIENRLAGGGAVAAAGAAEGVAVAGVGVAATIAGVVAALGAGAVVIGAGYLLSKLVNPQGNSGNIMGGGMPLTGGGTNTAPLGFGPQTQRGTSGGGTWGTKEDAAFKATILDNPSLNKLSEIAGLIGLTNSILYKEWGSAAGKIAGITARSEAAHGGKAPTQSAIDRTFTNDLLFQTKKIVADGHTTASRIADLERLQSLATSRGDTATAGKITAAIAALNQTLIDKKFETTTIVGSDWYKPKATPKPTAKPKLTPTTIVGSDWYKPKAAGFLGTVSGATDMTVGEAGRETVAILRNPRALQGDASRATSSASFLVAARTIAVAQAAAAASIVAAIHGISAPRVTVSVPVSVRDIALKTQTSVAYGGTPRRIGGSE
jgi:hypothetical protein